MNGNKAILLSDDWDDFINIDDSISVSKIDNYLGRLTFPKSLSRPSTGEYMFIEDNLPFVCNPEGIVCKKRPIKHTIPSGLR